MTEKLPFTQQSVRRAIGAARKAGLFVLAIRADGTVIVGEQPFDGSKLLPTAAQTVDEAERAFWDNVKA
jgi:hypothetical protein